MDLSKLERSELNDFTYYTVHVWKDKSKSGSTLSTAFKRKGNAVRKAMGLINCGKFEYINIRKVEVYKRNANCEYSSSGIVEEFYYKGI